ncbi:MAG: DUF3450 family protein [Methylomonas sp.]|nr:DUF3450 family protein [Methylomonas sp.]
MTSVPSKTRINAAGLMLAGVLGFSLPSRADNLENLAQSLIAMRGEVEELQSQLDIEKQSHKTKMDALSTQLADLSVENQRQEVSIEKLQQALENYEKSAIEAKSGDESLVPVMLQTLDGLSQTVSEGLPFKTEERLAELADLRNQIETRVLGPKKAANRLWAFVEGEIQLTRENGVYSQTIELDGEKRLVDVAKLGTVFLYFRASDNRVGKAVKQQGGWKFVELKTPEDKQQISLLFESLKKQIRQGYFELPNPLES